MGIVMETIKSRRSIRAYKPDAVPQEDLDKIVEAGLYAPSAMGRQECIVVEVTDKAARDRISALNASIMGRVGADPFYGAPAILIVLGKKDYAPYIYDGSVMMQNMMLEAKELGLGTCWIHRAKEEFESEEGKELLKSWGIEGNYEGIGHLAVGYPSGDCPEAPARKENRVYKVL